MADKYYTNEEVLLEVSKGKDKIRLMIGSKAVRGEDKEYLDLRVWYPDDEGNLCPGKGFAKPLSKGEMTQIADAISEYVNRE